MVEGSQIDFAGHQNDTRFVVDEHWILTKP